MMATRIGRSPHMRRTSSLATGLMLILATGASRAEDPPTPSGAHPRLFMSAANLALFTTNTQTSSTVAAKLVANCQDTITNPGNYTGRGGVDGSNWPGSA